jgi:hypothetical protein
VTQLAACRAKKHAPTRKAVFLADVLILKTMMLYEVTTVLNKRKHHKTVIRSVLDSVCLHLGRTEWLGLAQPHHHASLLNSSIQQVNCVGGMVGIEPTLSKSNNWTPLSPCQLGQGGSTL